MRKHQRIITLQEWNATKPGRAYRQYNDPGTAIKLTAEPAAIPGLAPTPGKPLSTDEILDDLGTQIEKLLERRDGGEDVPQADLDSLLATLRRYLDKKAEEVAAAIPRAGAPKAKATETKLRSLYSGRAFSRFDPRNAFIQATSGKPSNWLRKAKAG